ncbi:MAG: adenylosuccinate lyase, partial [Planctomycetes bacterium]|nr:adenylosuccinate lyase [Planctomycetota bacterium]
QTIDALSAAIVLLRTTGDPEAFLTADALLILARSVIDGLVVYPAQIAARIDAELPFIASEPILMAAAARGGDRQALHERIRKHSRAAAERVKGRGEPNDLIERLKADPAFARVGWQKVLDARRYVGLAPQQTRAYLRRHVRPLLARHTGREAAEVELRV